MSGSDALRAGEMFELAGDFLDAAATYGSVLNDPDPLVVAEARFRLGRVAWKQGRFDEAVSHFGVARHLAVSHGSSAVRALVENGLGVIHHERGELEQARACYGVALDLAQDDAQRGRILLNLGAIANIQADFETARKHYQRSRALFQHSAYARGEALALHNLGMLYADEGLWDEADESYRQCLEILEALGDRPMIARVLLNRSEVSCARERFDEAISNCDLAITICSEVGDEVERGDALRWKGHGLRLMGRHDSAQKALTEAIRIAARTQVKLLEAESSRDMGHSLAATGDHAGAHKRLERALRLFEELGAQLDAADVRAAIAAIAR